VDEQNSSWWTALTGFFSGDEVVARVALILLGGIITIVIFRLSIRRVVQQVVTGVKKAHGVDDTQALETSPVEAMR